MYDEDYDFEDDVDRDVECPECGAPMDGRACSECDYHEEDMTFSGGDDGLIDGVGFADPGGTSALRAATRDNPRNLPCPTCGTDNRLTPADVARGYQCDSCADRDERGF